MAKDAKGHGSERRGGSTFDRLNADRKSQGYKPMPEKSRGIHDFFDYMEGKGPKPDAMVAAELARGNPKATRTPVHSGAAGRTDDAVRFSREQNPHDPLGRHRLAKGTRRKK